MRKYRLKRKLMLLCALTLPLMLIGCGTTRFDTSESTSLVLPPLIQYDGELLNVAAIEAESGLCPVHVELGKDYVLTRDRIRIAQRELEKEEVFIMTSSRTAIQDLSTSNAIYAKATVTFYTVAAGEKTSTKATLYSTISGSTELANPQTLDSYGKLKQPVYIQEAVIASVTGLGNTPDHDTGIINVPRVLDGTGTPEGVVTAGIGTLFLRTDGGASTTLYVKESGTGNTGWVAK